MEGCQCYFDNNRNITSAVIPGCALLGAGPESITPTGGYGFRARAEAARPGMTEEKGRPVSRTAFPVLRRLHIKRAISNLKTGGLSPGRVLLGSRCISGQSRSGSRTDAMVSHLRKMG